MIWLWILLGLFSVFMLLVFLGACKIGAEADERMGARVSKNVGEPFAKRGRRFARGGDR